MNKASKVMIYAGWGFTAVLIILWPVLTLPAGVFSKGYFTFWVVLSLLWGLMATIAGFCVPLWESKDALIKIIGGLVTLSPSANSAGTTPAQQAFPTPSFGKLSGDYEQSK